MGEWTPNTDYDNEATWPPRGHPLSSLFHNARLQWPNNAERGMYERVAEGWTRLRSKHDAAVAIVREVFEKIHQTPAGYCPYCHGFMMEGHAPDCGIGKFLAEHGGKK